MKTRVSSRLATPGSLAAAVAVAQRLPVLQPVAVAALACLAGVSAHAQSEPAAVTDQVVVTGSVNQRLPMQTPYAISVVGREDVRNAGPQVNLSEAMVRVPGLVVNNRNNYAQDLQISSRGFGARAGFGVRGVRLYADGIPASGPDGQGQVSHFDLPDAQRVEVLRGPFSVLYGNSSGGVISLIGAPVTRREAEVELDAGTQGTRQVRATVAAPLGEGWDARISASHFQTDGFRPQSAAQRDLAQARLGWQGEHDKVTLLANYLDQPADDPLGLTAAEFAANPYQTTAVATQYDTRKIARQGQLGASWRHQFAGDGALRESTLATYAGRRGVEQWQSIPPSSQVSAKSGGGVVNFDRSYNGVEGKLRWLLGNADLVTGVALDRQTDDRRGYNNYTGTSPNQVLGVTGDLRRNETNTARTRDAYAQLELPLSDRLTASAGLRSGQVTLSTTDAYLSNGDDSGRMQFSYTNPVVGLRWQHSPQWQWHVSAARGFEAPTLGELAYRPDGTSGFNTGLQAQTSRQLELGSKWRGATASVDVTTFAIHVDNELAVLTNSGGRSSYQNVGRTLRTGLELAGAWQPATDWRTRVALTKLNAHYQDDFKTCVGAPCTTPTVAVPAGNRIAGTQPTSAWLEAAWLGGAWGEWALEARGVGKVAANDSNDTYAAGYGLLALRWIQRYSLSAGRQLEVLARLDNLADRAYAGSVIVNDGNKRYLETGAPRTALVGVRLIGGF